jgi:3D-(3,5/4)-trihydroxycyclohexane-1,2-dione acylhydrolase (decyclizing)
MVTAAAVAMSNRVPILFLPGDTFSSRFPDPVLQQVEHFNNPGITANDAFKPVTRYFDRITRPEQIISSLQQALHVMLDPADCGPACISLSQDVQGETYDYPEEFFKERIHTIRRAKPDDFQIKEAVELIKKSKKPIIISGGGVFYSDATDELSAFAIKHNIPVTQTVMGYSTMKKDHSHYLGVIGGLGGRAANNLSKETDTAIAIGTKLADFTTGSWANFENPNFKLVSINAARFDANKHMAQAIVGDAKVSLMELSQALGNWKADDSWYKKSRVELKDWESYVDKESGPTNQKLPSYAQVVGACYRNSEPSDIAVTAAGGLVGEVIQVWKPRELNTHETEWGFSCMSYEISGALGIKMANPDKEVISFVGDGSYLLYNSDIYSSVITNNKLIIIVCDNGGHAVINRLQLYKGGKEFNCLLKSSNNSNLVPVDFPSHARSMGANGEQVNSIADLEEAFKRAKKSKKTYVISIHTDGYQWLEGSAYWESPTLSIPTTEENKRSLKEHLEGKKKQRKGV